MYIKGMDRTGQERTVKDTHTQTHTHTHTHTHTEQLITLFKQEYKISL